MENNKILADDDDDLFEEQYDDGDSSSSDEDDGYKIEDTNAFKDFVKSKYLEENNSKESDDGKIYSAPSKELMSFVLDNNKKEKEFDENAFLANYVLKGKWKDEFIEDEEIEEKVELKPKEDFSDLVADTDDEIYKDIQMQITTKDSKSKKNKTEKKGNNFTRPIKILNTSRITENGEIEKQEKEEGFISEREKRVSKSKRSRLKRKRKVKKEKEEQKDKVSRKKGIIRKEIFNTMVDLKRIVKGDHSEIDKINFKSTEKLEDKEIEKEEWKKMEKNKILNEIFYPQFDASKKSEEELNLRKQIFLKFRKYYDLFGKRKIDDFSSSKYRYKEIAPDETKGIKQIINEEEGRKKRKFSANKTKKKYKSKKKSGNKPTWNTYNTHHPNNKGLVSTWKAKGKRKRPFKSTNNPRKRRKY